MAINRTFIEIEFRPDAIYLTHRTERVGDKSPPVVVSQPVRDAHPHRGMYIPYAFNNEMHRIKVSATRKTKFEFKIKPQTLYPRPQPLDREWLFYGEGFELQPVSKPHQSKFTDRMVSSDRRKVTIDFDPQGEQYRDYYYYLWLEAPCVENGVDAGHMIIIVDPIIGSDEL